MGESRNNLMHNFHRNSRKIKCLIQPKQDSHEFNLSSQRNKRRTSVSNVSEHVQIMPIANLVDRQEP